MFTTETDRFLTLLAATGLLLALGATRADAAAYARIADIQGESGIELSGLDIKPFGPAPLAAMLLPAVQAAREAARVADFAHMACDGSVLPELIIDLTKAGSPRPHLRYKLKDVYVTSYGVHGEAGADANEEITLGYGGIEWTYVESGETVSLDCSSGRCVCAP